jgi:hypothetical protein
MGPDCSDRRPGASGNRSDLSGRHRPACSQWKRRRRSAERVPSAVAGDAAVRGLPQRGRRVRARPGVLRRLQRHVRVRDRHLRVPRRERRHRPDPAGADTARAHRRALRRLRPPERARRPVRRFLPRK